MTSPVVSAACPRQAPFLVSPLDDGIARALAGLAARAPETLTTEDRDRSVALLAEAFCGLVDTVFVVPLTDVNTKLRSPVIAESLATAEDIKGRIRQYMGWLAGFLPADRLGPAIRHYDGVVHELTLHGVRRHWIVFDIDVVLAAEARRILTLLHEGSAEHLDEGVEILIRIIEQALEPAALAPKRLMEFSFLVDKTLDCVITLTLALFKRMLRQLPAELQRDCLPRVAGHLECFLITTQPA